MKTRSSETWKRRKKRRSRRKRRGRDRRRRSRTKRKRKTKKMAEIWKHCKNENAPTLIIGISTV